MSYDNCTGQFYIQIKILIRMVESDETLPLTNNFFVPPGGVSVEPCLHATFENARANVEEILRLPGD